MTLPQLINEVFNKYFERYYAATGAGRYFPKEYVTQAMFDNDPELEKDILAALKTLKVK